jgi:hypothetical protein
MRIALLAAGLALVITPALANTRNFSFYNDTSREVTAMATSAPDDRVWRPVTGDPIPPYSRSQITFASDGPCIVRLKIQFSHPGQEVNWTDGFNLCDTSSLRLYYDDGKYYIRKNDN